MGFHVPFDHRKNNANQPPVYIGFESPHYANQRHYQQLYVAPQRRSFNWSAFIGLMMSLMAPFTLFLLAPIALLFSLGGMRRAPRGMAFFGTMFSLGGTAILATIIFGIASSHHEDAYRHQRASQARQLQQERIETSATLDAATAQLEQFKKDNDGQLPNGVDGNVITIGFVDAWEKELRYEPGDEQVIVRSAGPDGNFGNGDDMVSTVAGQPWQSLADSF